MSLKESSDVIETDLYKTINKKIRSENKLQGDYDIDHLIDNKYMRIDSDIRIDSDSDSDSESNFANVFEITGKKRSRKQGGKYKRSTKK